MVQLNDSWLGTQPDTPEVVIDELTRKSVKAVRNNRNIP